jgi:carboxypeptidase Taq
LDSSLGGVWQDLGVLVGRMDALAGARGLLEWDQLCMMPPQAAAGRGEQLAALAAVYHEILVSGDLGRLLDRLEDALDSAEPEVHPVHRGALRNLRRERDRAVKLPLKLVEALERSRARGHQAWLAARKADDFAPFQPALTELVALAGEAAACLVEPGGHPYDAMLGAFEPGARTADLGPLFERLAAELAPLLDALRGSGWPDASQGASWPMAESEQRAQFLEVVEAMGFDFSAGRLDSAVHPFTCGMDPGDVRITARYDEGDLLSGLGTVLHEAGHGLYEQGVPPALLGTGVGRLLSTAVHESQSRFWENMIGRSRPFCGWVAGRLQARHPGRPWDPELLFQALNRVRPGLVRVDADEVTYNLHVLVRYRLELGLVEGSLAVADLPEAWDAAYEQYLGLRAPSPLTGVLQDVHWAEGLLGYFPTYTLGTLYAASLARAMEQGVPDLWERVGQGDLGGVLGWLREHVHRYAALFDGAEIFAQAAPGRDPVEDFMDHLWARHGATRGLLRPPRRS